MTQDRPRPVIELRRDAAAYEPPSWLALLAMADEAVAATAGDIELPPDPYGMPLEVAQAAVARTRQLLSGIVALLRAGLPDVCGVLIRPLYECWLVGLYGLLGGPDALERLVAQQDRHLKPILAELGDPTGDPGQPIPVEQLAQAVATLLESSGTPNAQFSVGAYKTLYRMGSYRSTHGGLGSIEGHIDRRPTGTVILPQRPDDDWSMRHSVFVAVAIFISGAQVVAIEAGRDHERLDRLASEIYKYDPANRRTS